MGEPSTGRRGTGGQTINRHAVRAMRRANVALSVTCRPQATGVTTGERSDTETVTLRSERGDWKRAIARWYLASCLLNLDHPFKNKHSETEMDLHPLLANTEESLYNQI